MYGSGQKFNIYHLSISIMQGEYLSILIIITINGRYRLKMVKAIKMPIKVFCTQQHSDAKRFYSTISSKPFEHKRNNPGAYFE